MLSRSFDQITTLTYFNLNLRSYGQLFVLVFFYIAGISKIIHKDNDISAKGKHRILTSTETSGGRGVDKTLISEGTHNTNF